MKRRHPGLSPRYLRDSGLLSRIWRAFQVAAGVQGKLHAKECGRIIRSLTGHDEPHGHIQQLVRLGVLVPYRDPHYRRTQEYLLPAVLEVSVPVSW